MEEQSPPTLLTRAVAYGPPSLLVAVALLQLWCACVDGRLTPAKGGGFGLFSTVDKLNNRHVRAYLPSAGRGPEEPIPLPPAVQTELRLQAWTVKAFPTDTRLRSFARQVEPRVAREPAATLRIEVVKMTFDGETRQARFRRVNDVRYPEERE